MRVLRVRRAEHARPVLLEVVDELRKVAVEVGDRVAADGGERVAPGLGVAQLGERLGVEGAEDLRKRFGELRVARQGPWEVVEVQEPIDWQGKGAMDPVRLASFTRHCREFFAAIQTGAPCPVSGWDGRQAVAAALAAYESSRTGKEVVLT